MNRLTAAIVLPLRFGKALVLSAVQTIQLIVRQGLAPGTPLPAAFIRIDFAPMNAQGASLLAAMICLTPGTTVVDIDMEQRMMLVHMLDTSGAEGAVEEIRRDWEPPLLAWFGVAA